MHKSDFLQNFQTQASKKIIYLFQEEKTIKLNKVLKAGMQLIITRNLWWECDS